ncbi:MAG: HEAT repeat domain-containing protein [Candidatus Aminicenantes bacterium]|nr:HEAT repeat domain-containing protein [Candidatus Aminicenantes bacterium]
MSKKKWVSGLLLLLLAVIFSIGLTFASIELPELLQKTLYDKMPALDGDSHAGESAEYRTELFISHYNIRLIGYICFGLMVALIVAGFFTGKKGLTSTGALLMFLPVFAQFAAVMFFLAGLGMLNVIWLPVLDVSFDAGRLGDIVYLPYNLLRSLFLKAGIDIHYPLVYGLIGLGLLLFVLGTFAWFTARQRQKNMADFWVYRISRHPQYLGWIVWSYGMLLSLNRVRYPKRSWGIAAALPWLLSAVIIIGVALLEERKMKRQLGQKYEAYIRKTPFLFPLPKWFTAVLSAPSRLFFKKKIPERKGEIAVFLAVYTLLFVGLSHVYVRSRRIPKIPDMTNISASASREEKLIEAIRRADNWHARRPHVAALKYIGEPAVDPLIDLLQDPDAGLRDIAAGILGDIGSPRAVDALIKCLSDPNNNVRFSAVNALGKLHAKKAVDPLLRILEEGGSGQTPYVAAVALGRIGSLKAVDPLIALLNAPRWWVRSGIIAALGQLGSEKAVEPLLELLEKEDQDVQVRREIMAAFHKIGSEKALPALRKALEDEDEEVRLYAAEAIKAIHNNRSSQ